MQTQMSMRIELHVMVERQQYLGDQSEELYNIMGSAGLFAMLNIDIVITTIVSHINAHHGWSSCVICTL